MSQPLNPYQPSGQSIPDTWGQQPQKKSTTGITVVSILFLVFGTLGALSSVGAVIAFFMTPFFESLNAGNPAAQKIQEAQKGLLIWGVALAIINGLISIGLIVSASLLLYGKRSGASLGRKICWVAILFEVARGVLTVVQNLRIGIAMTQSTMEDVRPEVAEQVEMAMQIGLVVGLIFGLIFCFGKMVMYALAGRHLSKASTLAQLQ